MWVDYIFDINLNEFDEINNFFFIIFLVDDFIYIWEFNYGVIIGGGMEYSFGDFVGMLLEFNFYLDFLF